MLRQSADTEADACLAYPRITNYRETILNIHSQLASRDVNALKFLCMDQIPFGVLERAKHALQIFEELEKLCVIESCGNVTFLAELLWHIGRRDLVKKLGFSNEQTEALISNPQLIHVPTYRLLLHNLCNDLTREECNNLKYVCERVIPRSQLESIREPRDFFLALESHHKISPNDLSYLLAILRKINREDLARKVESFCNAHQHVNPTNNLKRSRDTVITQERSQNETSRCVATVTGTQFIGSTNSMSRVISTQTVDEFLPNTSSDQNLANDKRVDDLLEHREVADRLRYVSVGDSDARSASRNDPENECYSMTRRPRGICLIISNEKFYKIEGDSDSVLMPDRQGTGVDRDSLAKTFESLHFVTDVKDDLAAEDMMSSLRRVAEADHSSYDCFVCCILTHGKLGCVYGVNGRTVAIRDLMSSVNAVSCSSLRGKPKLFFIQACQGQARQSGHDIEADSPDDTPCIETVPNEADFLLGLATVPGYVSYRSRSAGSWYISTLVRMLKHYHDRLDLLSILTRVNNEVSKAVAMQSDHYKQVPQPSYTLRKQVFFK